MSQFQVSEEVALAKGRERQMKHPCSRSLIGRCMLALLAAIHPDLRQFASGCGRNWNFTRIGFEIDRYSPFSTANPSSACHTVSEPVDE